VELDWTTFILEIINFLVLVWILQRFLYRPVAAVVAQRRAAIVQSLNEAQATQTAAALLKGQYESRLSDWQKEKEDARKQLRSEIEEQRQKLLAVLQSELAEQRRKEQVLAERRGENLLREARQNALRLSEQFTAKLLQRLASPAVEGRLLDMMLEDLVTLPDEQRRALAAAQSNIPAPVRVFSAFPISGDRRQGLKDALQMVLATPVDCEFGEDPTLLSGISVHIGARRLQASLKEELRFFNDALRHES
jgi:F-type H+-transporting ATPase subunit b